MKRATLIRMLISSVTVLTAFSGVAAGQPETKPVIAALGVIQPGLWEMHSSGDPSQNRTLCVSNAQILFQLKHEAQSCSVFVIANNPRDATVHYSCGKSGNGRTTLRVENARLIQIESQGIINRAPFLFTGEGRRVGACVGGVGNTGR
jgi:hypothetical protein